MRVREFLSIARLLVELFIRNSIALLQTVLQHPEIDIINYALLYYPIAPYDLRPEAFGSLSNSLVSDETKKHVHLYFMYENRDLDIRSEAIFTTIDTSSTSHDL